MDNDVLDVNLWIQYAQEDYDHAVDVAKANHPYSARKACYDCQQSAEKIFKAYTIANGGTRSKEHDLNVLRKQCEQYSPDFNTLKVACSVLNEHITKSRYPDGQKLTAVDMNEALKYADEILKFTKLKLEALGYKYDPGQTQ